MTTSPYFNTVTPNAYYTLAIANGYLANVTSNATVEQSLLDSLVTEAIQVAGMDVYYVRRYNTNLDKIYEEDPNQTYANTYTIEMYLNNFAGYSGQGEIFSKFGLEVRDEVVLTVDIKRFANVVGTTEGISRPYEGDLIYIPVMNDMFEIKYVDHRKVFYQLGSLYSYELRCSKYEYSSEKFTTGVAAIDNLMANNTYSVANTTTVVPNTDVLAINTTLTNKINTLDLIDFTETNPFGDIPTNI